MNKVKNADYRTRGFEITKKASRGASSAFPTENPPRSSIIKGNDLRVKENKKR